MKSRLLSDQLKKNKQTNKQITHEFKMTKWQTLCLIFTTVYFSRNFITCRFFTPLSLFYWLTSNFLPTSICTFFSKIEYIYFIQYGGSKTAHGFNSFLNNKWGHHDINSIVKVYLLANLLNRREFRGKTTPISSPYNFKKIFYKWFNRVIIGQTIS